MASLADAFSVQSRTPPVLSAVINLPAGSNATRRLVVFPPLPGGISLVIAWPVVLQILTAPPLSPTVATRPWRRSTAIPITPSACGAARHRANCRPSGDHTATRPSPPAVARLPGWGPGVIALIPTPGWADHCRRTPFPRGTRRMSPSAVATTRLRPSSPNNTACGDGMGTVWLSRPSASHRARRSS